LARSLLRLLGTRYGIALVLLVFVIGAVSLARAVSGPSDATSVTVPPVVSTTGGPSTKELGDDGVATEETTSAPSVSAGASAPEAVALSFTNAWLKRDLASAAWLQGIRPYSTANLMDLLRDADPASVPVTGIRGEVSMKARDAGLTEVTVPLSSGSLHLTLIGSNGRWLVDSVEWIKQ
jgi:hypothetical protein